MHATTHQVNADLEKQRIRNRLLRNLKPWRIRAAVARCRAPAALDAYVQELRVAFARTAALPILDAPRLRVGALTMLYGAIAFVLGIAGAAWALSEAPEELEGVLFQIATLCAVIGGAFLMLVGRGLRHEPHLPMTVSAEDITTAQSFLEAIAESARAAASAYSKHIVAALMTLDAAVLLFLVAPLLLPETVPMAQLLIIAIGAFLVARISLEAIAAIAKSVRVAQVLYLHAAKIAEGASTCAAAIRKAYEGVVGPQWPLNPGWIVYVPAVLWMVPLIGLQCLLLGVRLIAGDDTDMMAALVIAGTIAVLTTLFAVRTAINAECLTPEIANAKRLLGRFPAVRQLQATLNSDWESLEEAAARAWSYLVVAAAPRVHGIQTVTLESVGALMPPKPETLMLSIEPLEEPAHAVC
jgi:hypothetical protein